MCREREMIKKVLLLNKSIEFPSAIVNHLTISIKFVSLTMRAVIKKKTLSVHILIPLRSSDRKKLFMLQKLWKIALVFCFTTKNWNIWDFFAPWKTFSFFCLKAADLKKLNYELFELNGERESSWRKSFSFSSHERERHTKKFLTQQFFFIIPWISWSSITWHNQTLNHKIIKNSCFWIKKLCAANRENLWNRTIDVCEFYHHLDMKLNFFCLICE